MIVFVSPASEPEVSTAPLFTERCPAGFPSPAADYTEDELDLNAYCISRPSATYFVRAIGDSMKDIGLHSGDLMVVDKAETPVQGDIVIAETGGEFTVKRLQLRPRIALLPMNPAYPTLYPEELQIFGVVTAFIHKTREQADVCARRRELLLRQLREGVPARSAGETCRRAQQQRRLRHRTIEGSKAARHQDGRAVVSAKECAVP